MPADTDQDTPLEPDELIADISRPSLGRELLISIGIHAVVLLITSIGFIALCFRHHTLDPRAAINAIEQAKRDQELEAKREAARAKILAAQAQRKAGETKTGTAAPPDKDGAKPKILETIHEKSSKRPASSNVSLDELE